MGRMRLRGRVDGIYVGTHRSVIGAYRPPSLASSDTTIAARTYLLAIAIFVNGANGHSALQLSRDLDCQYKTAFVLSHKLPEAMASETANATLEGTVEVDGAYFDVM